MPVLTAYENVELPLLLEKLSRRERHERVSVALDLVDLDEALTALSRLSERESRIVEMRYFGGLTFRQIADVLEVSEKTVQRDWTVARAWLYQHLRNGVGD